MPKQTATIEQIRSLRTEAGESGDLEMVAICDRAIAGDDDARAECDRVIGDARAVECRYIIQCRHASGSSHWDREPDTEEYETEAEAERIIATLEAEDEDGADLEYRVTEAP